MFHNILLAHAKAYPGMEPTDGVKLAYQNAFGPAHFVDPDRALALLREERLATPTRDIPQIEEIGGGYVRFHLSTTEGFPVSDRLLSRIFAASAVDCGEGERGRFRENLAVLRELTKTGVFSFTTEALEAYLTAYEVKGCPPVSHSGGYKAAYAPAYRVLRREYGAALSVLTAIDNLLSEQYSAQSSDPRSNHAESSNPITNAPVTVAIDGGAASGKTTLAALISTVFDCDVIHMDDFFLPPEMRTTARLSEPGGNVHYERFREEVAPYLKENTPFSYGIFDCSVMKITEQREITPKLLYVVEGSYSHHPEMHAPYDLRIFLKIPPERQMERIIKRNGNVWAEKFRTQWIPMENAYFQHFEIEKRADLVIE